MKLVTWNVNSLKIRMPRVLELLELHRPALVLLQETKAEPDAVPLLELEAAGYVYVVERVNDRIQKFRPAQ